MYRTVYADGLIGGFTPANSVCLNFYATRNPIPKATTHDIGPDNTVSPEGKLSDDSKIGIIREIEFGVYMNEQTARDIYAFLQKMFDNK